MTSVGDWAAAARASAAALRAAAMGVVGELAQGVKNGRSASEAVPWGDWRGRRADRDWREAGESLGESLDLRRRKVTT